MDFFSKTANALYSNCLHTFAHLATKWINMLPYEDFESLPCDYYFFASQCTHLKTFATTVAVPCEAIWCLAMKGRQLQNLYVCREQILSNYIVCLPFPTVFHKVFDIAALKTEVSQWLNREWCPMSESEIAIKTRYLTKF